MHITTGRFYIKEGMEDAFIEHMQARFDAESPPGQRSTHVVQWRKDSREFMLISIFDDYDIYHDYSHTPESEAKYKAMAEFFDRDPVWLDGPLVAESV